MAKLKVVTNWVFAPPSHSALNYRKSPDSSRVPGKRRVPDTGRVPNTGRETSCRAYWKRVERRRHLVGRRTKWLLEVQEEENAMICKT